MMRYFLLCCLLRAPFFASAQATYTISNFSPDYYGKIRIEDTTQVFSPGWVAIYNKKTNKEIIKVVSEELALTLHAGKAVANIKQLPYGEQSLIIYEDFNFDGIKDLAIEDGQNSCYHGPSFQVYTGTQSGFEEDSELTRLAQEYCGLFQVNKKEKTLSTMTKSGCCWHQFSEYKFINNNLQAIKIVEDDHMHFPFATESIQTWDGKKMVTTTHQTIDKETEGVQHVLSFRLEKNNKEVFLFAYEEQLYYTFMDEAGNIELAYPSPDNEQNSFRIKDAGNKRSLSFTNKNATYEVSETSAGNTVLLVTTGGKSYASIGKKTSKTGSLKDLPSTLSNVQGK